MRAGMRVAVFVQATERVTALGSRANSASGANTWIIEGCATQHACKFLFFFFFCFKPPHPPPLLPIHTHIHTQHEDGCGITAFSGHQENTRAKDLKGGRQTRLHHELPLRRLSLQPLAAQVGGGGSGGVCFWDTDKARQASVGGVEEVLGEPRHMQLQPAPTMLR